MRIHTKLLPVFPCGLLGTLLWLSLFSTCVEGEVQERAGGDARDVAVVASVASRDDSQPDSRADTTSRYFAIRAVDEKTGRGIPLVEFETVHHVCFVTDSAGWIALDEPAWIGRKVYFHVRSHGYEYPRDGFGNAGITVTPQPGEQVVVCLQRKNVAERLYRITGEGIYRDSLLLNRSCPLANPESTGQVLGQDSVQAAVYRNRIYWFWGDTNCLRYPLGHFATAGATSQLSADGGLDPARGIDLQYFVGADGFSRPMARLNVDQGMVWIDAVCVLDDDQGEEQLVCHYTHMKSLDRMLDHGIAVYDSETDRFERCTAWGEKHRDLFPGGAHALRRHVDDREWIFLGEVIPSVRFPADITGFTNPASAQVWSCLEPGSTVDDPRFLRSPDGRLDYDWRQGAQPVDISCEWRWMRRGLIDQHEARGVPLDVDTQEPVLLHRGSVNWNPYRRKWILIAGQQGGTSYLGEIWYAESDSLMGPWRQAKKIVTHDKYSFYNPVHHAFFDQAGGRLIYFEGTYTTTFANNDAPTPRYDYNQVMYRLDLDDPRLKAARQ